jgi:hypothetical protein
VKNIITIKMKVSPIFALFFGHATAETIYEFGEYDSAVQYLGVAASPDFSLGGNDFVYESKITPYPVPAGHHGGTIISRHKSGVAQGWALIATNSRHVVMTIYGAQGYHMQANWQPSCVADKAAVALNGVWGGELMSSDALPLGVETTLAVVRQGNDLKLFINGTQQCQATVTSWSENAVHVPHTIGAHYTHGSLSAAPFYGKITNTKFTTGSVYPLVLQNCDYTNKLPKHVCEAQANLCDTQSKEADVIRTLCTGTCRQSPFIGKTTAGPNAGQRTCITSSAPTNQPTSKPTKSPTVPPTQAPSRRPHVASGRSNDHSGEYHEDNFDCYYKNCQEWDCAMWCKCFEQETEDADLYADSGCEDDGDNSCECVENVLGLHETEDNWDFFGEASAKPDQTKPHYKNIVVGKGEANFAETVKTFKRPFILDVWMKQDLDQEAAGYQTVPAPGNVFVFPQNTDSGCSGYCMGINQLGSAAYNFVNPMANDYFYFAGRDSEYQQRKNKLNGNQTSVNEHELWQKLTIKFSLQGTVAYYFNAEKNPRFETHDTTYMDGKIRLGKNVANYRYHSPQLTKGARDASVNIAPWRRLGSEYEEYWGEQYRTQWD